MAKIPFKSFFTSSANSTSSAPAKQAKHAEQETDRATTSTAPSESDRTTQQNISKKDRGATLLRLGKNENRHVKNKSRQVNYDLLVGQEAKAFESAILDSLQSDASGKRSWSAMKKNTANALAILQNLDPEQIERLPSKHRAAFGTILLNIYSHVQEQDSKIGSEMAELGNARKSTFNPVKVRASNQGLKNMKLAQKTLGDIREQVASLFNKLSEAEKISAEVDTLPENDRFGHVAGQLQEKLNLLCELDSENEEIVESNGKTEGELAQEIVLLLGESAKRGWTLSGKLGDEDCRALSNMIELLPTILVATAKEKRLQEAAADEGKRLQVAAAVGMQPESEQLGFIVAELREQANILRKKEDILPELEPKKNALANSLRKEADALYKVAFQNDQLGFVVSSLRKHIHSLRELGPGNEKLDRVVNSLKDEIERLCNLGPKNKQSNLDSEDEQSDPDSKVTELGKVAKSLGKQAGILREMDPLNEQLVTAADSLEEHAGLVRKVDYQNEQLGMVVNWLRSHAENLSKPAFKERLDSDKFEEVLSGDVENVFSYQTDIWEEQKNLFPDQKFIVRKLDSKIEKLGSIEKSLGKLVPDYQEIFNIQNSEQTDTEIAKKVASLFSEATRRGFDLPSELKNDEIVYLTRAMGPLARTSNEKGLVEGDKKVAVLLDPESGEMEAYDDVINIIKIKSDNQASQTDELVRQTAELLHKEKLERMLGLLATPNEHLQKAGEHLDSRAAGKVLREIKEAFSALEKVDKAEVSRLCKLDGANGQDAKRDVVGRLDLIEGRATSLLEVLESSKRSGFTKTGKEILEQATEWLKRVQSGVHTLQGKDDISQDAPQAPSPDVQTEKKKKRRLFPAKLHMLFPKEKEFRFPVSAATSLNKPTFNNTYDFTDEITLVKEQAVGAVVDFLHKMSKDTLTEKQFNNMMRFYKDHAFNAIEHKYDEAWRNIFPEWSQEELKKAKDDAQEHVIQLLKEAVHSEGWSRPQREESNVKWESPRGPLLIKRGLSLQQLKLDQENTASGTTGSVSIFKNENGAKLIGKMVKDDQEISVDALAEELEAYRRIYDIAGPHPNLVNVYGIAQVPDNDGVAMRTMIMDAVPGPTGEKFFDALYNAWQDGKISTEKYWGVIQFIGRRLLDVTEHMGKAGVVHNDIKPNNILVNEKTGEPVLIDLGLWERTGEKTYYKWDYSTPEEEQPRGSEDKQGVDERSDVFKVGATFVKGIEDPDPEIRKPNEGLFRREAFKDREGNVVREKASYAAETAYVKFINSVMERSKDSRLNSQAAKALDFLSDSFLDDDAARKVLQDVINPKPADIKTQTPEEEQWGLQLLKAKGERTISVLDEFEENSNLANYAKLRKESKTAPELRANPKLKEFLDNLPANMLAKIKQDAAERAEKLITEAFWFDDVKRIAGEVPKTVMQSGVDEKGGRREYVNKKADLDYELAVMDAKKKLSKGLSPHVNVEDLRRYAAQAEAFLSDAGIPEGEIFDDNLFRKVQQVRESMVVARRMVEIAEAPEPSMEARALLLERQFEQLKRRR